MSKFFKEFKEFAIKGNVMDMAGGIIIGEAFGKIVSSLVADLLMPLVGALVGGVNFTDWKWTIVGERTSLLDKDIIMPAVTLNYGNFIQVLLDFLIIAFCIFLLIKGLNKLTTKREWKRYRLRNLRQNRNLPGKKSFDGNPDLLKSKHHHIII